MLALPPLPRVRWPDRRRRCVFGFFALLAWTGWVVLDVLEGDTLVSLPWVPVQLTQSVIPIGAVLFILAQAAQPAGAALAAHARGRGIEAEIEQGDQGSRRNRGWKAGEAARDDPAAHDRRPVRPDPDQRADRRGARRGRGRRPWSRPRARTSCPTWRW